MKQAKLTSAKSKWYQKCPYCGHLNDDPDSDDQYTQECVECGVTFVVDNPTYEYQDA